MGEHTALLQDLQDLREQGERIEPEPPFPTSPHRYERGPYAVDGAQVCGICGGRRAASVHRGYDGDGFLRLKGTATGDNQLDPEPVGRTDPDTPVLVFRSASGRTEVARRAEGFSVHVLQGSDRLTTDEARRLGAKLARYPDATPEPQQAVEPPVLDLVRQYAQRWAAFCLARVHEYDGASDKAKAGALLDRIAVQVGWLEAEAARTTDALVKARDERDEARAALMPQQPVQARSGLGFPWWHHGCGEVARGAVPPRLHGCDKPGPWRPLLVGGNPSHQSGGS